MEFSKKILLVVGAVALVVTVFACVMMYITHDLSPLAYLIPAVGGVVATGCGFYYNKAKIENKIKLMNHYKVDLTESAFDDTERGYWQ